MFRKKRKKRYATNWLKSVRKKRNLKILYKRAKQRRPKLGKA